MLHTPGATCGAAAAGQVDGGTGGRSAGSPSFGAHGLMGGRASRRFQATRSAGQDGAQESGFYSSWPSSTPSREASRALSFGRSPAPFDLSSLRLVEQRQGEGGEEESGRPGRASGQARSARGITRRKPERDREPASAISPPETAGTRWRL